jgi:hypothetical protein
MPNKITKSEIRLSLFNAIQDTISKYGIAEHPKKRSKAIGNFSKKLATDIKDELKKKFAKESKSRAVAKKSKKQVPSLAD